MFWRGVGSEDKTALGDDFLHIGVADENRGVVGFGLDQSHAESVEIIRDKDVEMGGLEGFLDGFEGSVAVKNNRETMAADEAFGAEKVATTTVNVKREVLIGLVKEI